MQSAFNAGIPSDSGINVKNGGQKDILQRNLQFIDPHRFDCSVKSTRGTRVHLNSNIITKNNGGIFQL